MKVLSELMLVMIRRHREFVASPHAYADRCRSEMHNTTLSIILGLLTACARE